MPEKRNGSRQLRLINIGELDSEAGNPEEGDIADESWESSLDDIARMAIRLGIRLTPAREPEEETDDLAA